MYENAIWVDKNFFLLKMEGYRYPKCILNISENITVVVLYPISLSCPISNCMYVPHLTNGDILNCNIVMVKLFSWLKYSLALSFLSSALVVKYFRFAIISIIVRSLGNSNVHDITISWV